MVLRKNVFLDKTLFMIVLTQSVLQVLLKDLNKYKVLGCEFSTELNSKISVAKLKGCSGLKKEISNEIQPTNPGTPVSIMYRSNNNGK